MKIRVGSRESKLAVIQSQMVMDCIKKHHPDIELELVTMKTTGDIILDRTLDKVGGKGLFVKELDRALIDGEVDITVHSFKDMPMQVPENLPIVATSKRENPFDVLVLPKGVDTIDFSKPIGCSSARRTIQLQALYPEATVKSVRGNVITRLQKLDSGEYSALLLAYAGLKRLELEERISKVFTKEEMIPPACQGIVVVQARAGFDTSFLQEFHDEEAYQLAMCERAFVRELDGGCSAPIASFATMQGDKITMMGMYVSKDGKALIESMSASVNEATKHAIMLAKKLKESI
ncbi:MAG: hydroxymethylbilane synthase [Lachnospiraceae bacterium]